MNLCMSRVYRGGEAVLHVLLVLPYPLLSQLVLLLLLPLLGVAHAPSFLNLNV